MVMVPGEFLGEFVVGVVATVHQAPHDSGFLEERQVPVGRTLRQVRGDVQELWQRDRTGRLLQADHQLASTGGVAQVVLGKPRSDGAIEFR